MTETQKEWKRDYLGKQCSFIADFPFPPLCCVPVQEAFISLFSVRVFLSQQNHTESCLLLIVSCTNNNCPETMIRKDLDKHVTVGCWWRLVHCSYCNEPHPKCQGEVIIILSQLCFKPTGRTLPAEAF